MRLIPVLVSLSLVFALGNAPHVALGASLQKHGNEPTTAWKDGAFNIDVRQVVGRSDIVLQRPGLKREEAMPIGNGRLGLGVWAEECYTAQLNRQDTLPQRMSPGQIVLPGLCKLTSAADFSGRLDLYNGEFVERGGGMSATPTWMTNLTSWWWK
jgi:alpha-L-fucosidase 2